MICKNCGANIDNDSSFCIMCGQRVETRTNLMSSAEYGYKSVTGFKVVSIVITIIMFIISLTPLFSIELFIARGDTYAFKLFMKSLDLENEELIFFSAILSAVNLWFPLSLIGYMFSGFSSYSEYENEFVPIKGYGAMTSAIISIAVGFVTMFIANETYIEFDAISYTPQVYIALVLAIINRVAILPSYLRGIQHNMRLSKMRERESSHITTPAYTTPTPPDAPPTHSTLKFSPKTSHSTPSEPPYPTVYATPKTVSDNNTGWQCFGCGNFNPESEDICSVCKSAK
ncbi:MAG: zinc ribbon domain-containing protein [Clostridia bacterium]|nr:zinc ribbon domain-containing protein [Clostridia bacterium]